MTYLTTEQNSPQQSGLCIYLIRIGMIPAEHTKAECYSEQNLISCPPVTYIVSSFTLFVFLFSGHEIIGFFSNKFPPSRLFSGCQAMCHDAVGGEAQSSLLVICHRLTADFLWTSKCNWSVVLMLKGGLHILV